MHFLARQALLFQKNLPPSMVGEYFSKSFAEMQSLSKKQKKN